MEKVAKKGLNLQVLFWLPVIFLVLSQFLVSTENTLTALGISTFQNQFFGTVASIIPPETSKSINVIITSTYPIITGTFMISGALIGLKFGWKKIFYIGGIVVAFGEFATFILLLVSNLQTATTFGEGWAYYISFIILGRFLVSAGSSLLIPALIGLTSAIYKGRARFIAFALIGASAGLAGMLAYFTFGVWNFFTTDQLQYMFLVLAIFFILNALGAAKAFPQLPMHVHHEARKQKTGKWGIVFISLGLILLLLGLQMIGILSGLGEPSDIAFIAIPISLAIIFLILGVRYEKICDKNGKLGVLKLEYFKVKATLSGLILNMVNATGFSIWAFILAIYMLGQGLIDISGNTSNAQPFGIILLTVMFMSGSVFVFGIIGPKIFRKLSWRISTSIGVALVILGCFTIAFFIPIGAPISPGSNVYKITFFSQVHPMFFIGNLILGMGVGIISGYNGGIVVLTVNQRDAEISGGVQTSARSIGKALANTLLLTVFIISISLNRQANVSIEAIRDANKYALITLSVVLSVSFVVIPWIPKDHHHAMRIQKEREAELLKMGVPHLVED